MVTREELAFHPWRNVVLRSLQASSDAEPTDVDIVAVDARPGDRLLLCSDGLTDMVGDERIAEVLRLKDPHSAAAVLTHAALESRRAGQHHVRGRRRHRRARSSSATAGCWVPCPTREHRRPRRRAPRLTHGAS